MRNVGFARANVANCGRTNCSTSGLVGVAGTRLEFGVLFAIALAVGLLFAHPKRERRYQQRASIDSEQFREAL